MKRIVIRKKNVFKPCSLLKYLYPLVLLFLFLPGCKAPGKTDTNSTEDILSKTEYYASVVDTAKLIDPKEYVEYLKKTKFTHGELDNLPTLAIILHDTRVDQYLDSIGISKHEVKVLQTGTTDPSLLYVVRSKSMAFVITPGLPGGSGISTQVAELGGMGIRKVVHIGTCGVFSNEPINYNLIISSGCYRDEASLLMSDDASPAVKPDSLLRSKLTEQLKTDQVSFSTGPGYTIPIFYYQPKKMMLQLLNWTNKNYPKPLYIEMEGAAVFETSRIARMESASIVAPTDRYYMEKGAIKHEFVDFDSDHSKLLALKACLNSLGAK